MRRAARFALALLPAVVVLGWHAPRYLPFIADDALISLRYSARLLQGAGLTWTDGPPVEGYSNLLWVLLCALVGLFTDLVQAARIAGLACTLTAFAAVAAAGSRTWSGVAASAMALALLAFEGPVAVWAIGGLEQPLALALVLLATTSAVAWVEGPRTSDHELWSAASALALLCWTRPDSPLLVAAVAAGLAVGVGARAMLRPALVVSLPAAGAVLAQLAFRRAYYGDWVPNTARLKLAWSAAWISGGVDYLTSAWRVLVPALGLAVLGLAGALLARRSVRAAAVFWLPAVAWCTYVVLIGGDIFPGRRHLVVALGLLAAAGAWGLEAGLTRRRAGVALGALAAGCLGAGAWLGTQDPRSLDAAGERWEWEGQVSGLLFADAFAAERPTIAVHAAGCVPYFSNLPAIDLLGLNDAWIARNLPANHGQHSVLTDIHAVGDPDYVIGRKPDLILACGPLGSAGPCDHLPAWGALFAHPAFATGFVPMHFRGERPFTAEGTAFVRVDSRIATAPLPDGVLLKPAFLARPPATLVAEGVEAAVELPPRASLVVTRAPPGEPVSPAPGVSVGRVADGVLLENQTDAPVRLRGVALRASP